MGAAHAALVHVVHDSAGANADKRIDDALLFFAQERSDAQRVHGRGADGRKRLMLLHAFFQQRNAVGLERFQRRNLLGMVFYDAKAARTVDWLADDVARALRFPFFQRRFVGVAQVNPCAMDVFGKEQVKLRLVVKEVPERFFIHARDNAVGQRPRDHRLPLRGGEAVHLGNFVVHITGAIPNGAAQHIKEQPGAALAGFFVQLPGSFPHPFPVHPACALP